MANCMKPAAKHRAIAHIGQRQLAARADLLQQLGRMNEAREAFSGRHR